MKDLVLDEKTVFLKKTKYPSYKDWEDWFYAISFDRAVGASLKLENDNSEKFPTVAVIIGGSERFGSDVKGYAINHFCIDCLISRDLYPVFLKYDDNVISELLLAKPYGIFLPGGTFHMPPEVIDGPPPAPGRKFDLQTYNSYKYVLEYAKENRLPTFGICAGMQMLATLLGGKSVGHINEVPNPIHRDIINKKDFLHKVNIVPESFLHKIVGVRNLNLISGHVSKMVDKPEFTHNFNISARAPDGVIEAIEPINPWNEFVVGVQFHPEKAAYENPDGPEAKIFDEFAKAVRNKNLEFK